MGLLNTGLNALGTFSAIKSLLPNRPKTRSKTDHDLQNFLTEIRQNSIGRTNYFDVRITAPRVLLGDRAKIAPKISLYAEGTVLPGLSLQTGELKRFGVGPIEKYPYSLQTNTLSVNFIGDGKGEIYKFFYNWMQNIVKADVPVEQAVSSVQNLSQNGLASYEVEFKSEYAVKIEIFLYNDAFDNILQYELLEAFPTRIMDVPLSWANDNSLMQFGVDFEFLQSKLVNAEEPLKASIKSGLEKPSALKTLVKIGTAVQALSALRKPRNLQDALVSAGNIKNIVTRL
jgi:hypothetical protein